MIEYEFKTYDLKDYIEIDEEKINFPKELHIAYAVCAKVCGNSEFIVDGQSQRCEKCGHLLFRTAVKEYRLAEGESDNVKLIESEPVELKTIKILKNDGIDYYKISDYPEIDDSKVEFPKEIYINLSVCGKECGCVDFMVEGSTQVCQYCDHVMLPLARKKYVFADKLEQIKQQEKLKS